MIFISYCLYLIELLIIFFIWKCSRIEQGREIFHIPVKSWEILLLFLIGIFPVFNNIVIIVLLVIKLLDANYYYNVIYRLPKWINTLLFKEFK